MVLWGWAEVLDLHFWAVSKQNAVLLLSTNTGTGKLPWHKRAKRAVACSDLACQPEKRACVG